MEDLVTQEMKCMKILDALDRLERNRAVGILSENLDIQTQNKLYDSVKIFTFAVEKPKKKETQKKNPKKNASLEPEEQKLVEQKNEGVFIIIICLVLTFIEGVVKDVIGIYTTMKEDVTACKDNDLEISNCFAKIPEKIKTKQDVEKVLASMKITEENVNRLHIWNTFIYGMTFRRCTEFVNRWNDENPNIQIKIDDYVKKIAIFDEWSTSYLYKLAQFYELAKMYPKILLIKSLPISKILNHLGYLEKLCEGDKILGFIL